jgi:Phospholipase D-like domain at C-terminus of MIT
VVVAPSLRRNQLGPSPALEAEGAETGRDIQDSAAAAGINFTVTWDETIHDRSIRANSGWTILLGRGLDICQKGFGSQYDLAAPGH